MTDLDVEDVARSRDRRLTGDAALLADMHRDRRLAPDCEWLREPDPADPADEGVQVLKPGATFPLDKWEYRVRQLPQPRRATMTQDAALMEKALNEFGDDRWELVSASQVFEPVESTRLVFKRRKQQ